jgi:hypothetical protein
VAKNHLLHPTDFLRPQAGKMQLQKPWSLSFFARVQKLIETIFNTFSHFLHFLKKHMNSASWEAWAERRLFGAARLRRIGLAADLKQQTATGAG